MLPQLWQGLAGSTKLARMGYTCALHVVDVNPEGIGPNRLARLLYMAKQSADYSRMRRGRRSKVRELS
jgi:hypothetical protein